VLSCPAILEIVTSAQGEELDCTAGNWGTNSSIIEIGGGNPASIAWAVWQTEAESNLFYYRSG